MLLHLNGWAGVGKLTIARALAKRIDARILDNHTIYNVAFALTEFKSPEFYETVRKVRDIAFELAATVPSNIPIIVTNALGSSSPWADENWAAMLHLAKSRQCRLLAITLRCAKTEHLRRAMTPERNYLGKLTDPEQLKTMLGRDLLDPKGADHIVSLDTTNTAPDMVVDEILARIDNASGLTTTV